MQSRKGFSEIELFLCFGSALVQHLSIFIFFLWDIEQQGVQFVRVGQDTRLNNRVLDLRTPANQAIFRIQSQVSTVSILPWFFKQLCQCTSCWCHDCCCNISVYLISNTSSLVKAKMWIGMDNSSSDSSCWQRTLWSFTHQSC